VRVQFGFQESQFSGCFFIQFKHIAEPPRKRYSIFERILVSTNLPWIKRSHFLVFLFILTIPLKYKYLYFLKFILFSILFLLVNYINSYRNSVVHAKVLDTRKNELSNSQHLWRQVLSAFKQKKVAAFIIVLLLFMRLLVIRLLIFMRRLLVIWFLLFIRFLLFMRWLLFMWRRWRWPTSRRQSLASKNQRYSQ